jgi:tetratricopeptide (TPR) repeat protein
LEANGEFPSVPVSHPLSNAVFPRNLPAPILTWATNMPGVERWVVGFKAGAERFAREDLQPPWSPPQEAWQRLKTAAGTSPIELIVAGFARDSHRPQVRQTVRFNISPDAVESPLFFREVNLPFIDAVKDPSKIRWRFGPLDRAEPPPVVLENLPVCGNCHSFSRHGEHLAMDVDYANSKASYIITRTAPEMRLATSDIITWNDYRREDGRQTFGLLSQISPDGRYVVSTVKDRSVFVPRPELAFSQLFFPLKGILAVYDRQTKEFSALPGADDPAFVQSNPAWSPDGQWIVFARNQAAELEKQRDTASILLTPEECEEFLKRGKEFRYELYRVPFNGGKGGTAQPLRGASANGRSNYFPKYSPDGRWIIFCQASNYMLLQPDSELFIIPAEGGEARRLDCNLGRMNSWHSWSPDGKWLVFSSKAHSDYTQLYLTRISEQGEASPPVWLAHVVAPGRAANIPEFVALQPDAIRRIREQFLDDYSYARAGNEFFRAGDAEQAIAKFRSALALNPNNAMAHQRLGFLLFRVKAQVQEGIAHSRTAVQLEPQNGFAHYDLGFALATQNDLTNALPHLETAVRLLPNGYDRQYNAIEMHFSLGETYYQLARYPDCLPVLAVVLRHDPRHARANYLTAMAKAWLEETTATTPYFEEAIAAEPRLRQLPDYHDLLSRNYVQQGLYAEGLIAAETGHRLAVAAGRPAQAAKLQQRVELCRGRLPQRP